MSWVRVFAARLVGLVRRERLECDLDEEVRFHLDMQVEDNLRAGMAPAEARLAARRSFGAVEPMKESYRDRGMFTSIETVLQDMRYAVRTLRRSAGFTMTAVATLALAIGANAAMFSLLNAVLLRPLPYRAPDQLAMLWTEVPSQNLREGRSAYWNVELWRRESRSFSDLAVFDPTSATLAHPDGPERITVARISPNLLPLLGVEPLQGRIFSAEEAEQRQRLALISHRFWLSRLGGSPAAIGASIELDGLPSRIIGILPAAFQFARLDADVWEPHTMFPDWQARRAVRGSDSWFVVGRLRPNASVDQAQAEMSAIARRLDPQLPAADRNRGVSVVPLSLYVTSAQSRQALWMLAGAVFCVLLVAVANITSLSLVRGVARAREITVRAALGASAARIVRQLLVEGVTLAALSGLAGALLAAASVRLIRTLTVVDLARLHEASLDLRVLGWIVAISLLAGSIVGLVPAALVRGRTLWPSAEDGGRSVSGGVATRGLRRSLVVAEFALAIILLVSAGLLVRSWWHVKQVDPGFRPERVLALQVRTPVLMEAAQRAGFYQQVLDRIESLPGVESAGFTSDLFISSSPEQTLTTETGVGAASPRMQFRRDEVSGGLFRAIGTPLRKGRFFTPADGPHSPRVAIINEAMARQLWREADPVGQRFKVGARDSDSPWFTVVGVVSDMRRQGLERDAIPQMFEPLAQNPSGSGSLLVRTTLADPLTLAGSLRAAVRQVDAQAPLYGVTTLDGQLAASLLPRRLQTLLVVGFSAVSLLMAAIGIYGLIQYSIRTRTHEIGIRMALGAQAHDIRRMVIREGLTLSVVGLMLGLSGALWVSQAGRGLLFGVTATDPLTFAGVPLLLLAVAAAACYFPARRAAKIEPIAALRQS